MRLIKIGAACLDVTVGAVKSNTQKVIAAMKEMADNGCTIGCFQEQVLAGYPAEDFVQWKRFVKAQWHALRQIQNVSESLGNIVYTVGVTVEYNADLYNAVAVISDGVIWGIVPKEKLPTYDVFYDIRTFSLGVPYLEGELIWPCDINLNPVMFGDMIFQFPFGTLGAEVCEDIWSPAGPMKRRCDSGAEIIINASASPFRTGIAGTRNELVSTRASDNQATVVYVNAVGGNSNLVFYGGVLVNQNGRMLLESPRWQEGIFYQVVDLDRTTRLRQRNTTWRLDKAAFLQAGKTVKTIKASGLAPNNNLPYPVPGTKNFFLPEAKAGKDPREEFFDDIEMAAIWALKGYFEKTNAFKKIGIALSGGKDSVLTTVLAWLYAKMRFAGEEDIHEKIFDFIECISMPTENNSEKTRLYIRNLCRALYTEGKEDDIRQEVELEIKKLKAITGKDDVDSITRQNIQARIRGNRMNNWSNETGGMCLQTGNMTEKAVGYTTIGGDLMGAYSLIGNLPKTVIEEFLKYLAQKYNLPILQEIAMSKSSAELAPDQEDEKDLMPFPVLDACICLFVEEKMEPDEVIKVLNTIWDEKELAAMCPEYKAGMLEQWVEKFVTLFLRSIHKWVQAPMAAHLGSLELDRERALQLPVVQSGEWLKMKSNTI